MDIDLRAFLGRTFNLEAIADYETGPGSEVSAEMATGCGRGKQAVRRRHGGVG